jgi:hypothetical protein
MIAGAAILGMTMGVFWIAVSQAALDGGMSLNWAWNALIVLTCPVIATARLSVWIAPIFNGLIYGCLSYLAIRLLRNGNPT